MRQKKVIKKIHKEMEEIGRKRIKELEINLEKDFKKLRKKYNKLFDFNRRNTEVGEETL